MHALSLPSDAAQLARLTEFIDLVGMQASGVDRDAAHRELSPRRMIKCLRELLVELEPRRILRRIARYLSQCDEPALLAGAVALANPLEAIALHVDGADQHPDADRHIGAIVLESRLQCVRVELIAALLPGLAEHGVEKRL